MLFNNVQLERMQQSGDPAYQAVEQHYQQALTARGKAARRLLDSQDLTTKTTYFAAERTAQNIRQEGIALAEKESGTRYNDTNYIFLHFVTQHLPVGLVGLIMAAVFAAAMSTVSAELNSLATVTVIDHYRRYVHPNAEDSHYIKISKGTTVFWGVYATVFASFGGQLGSLIEAVNIVGSWFYGSMLGVFVLAFTPWRANGTGAFTGMLAGLAAVAWTNQNTSISFLWFNLVGCVVTVVVGLLASRMAKTAQRTS